MRGKIRHFWFGCWPGSTVGFDGASFCAVCAFCGDRILQDSWGQWFSIGPVRVASAGGEGR